MIHRTFVAEGLNLVLQFTIYHAHIHIHVHIHAQTKGQKRLLKLKQNYMQGSNLFCHIPILFAVSRIISRGSRFPAVSSDSRQNFAVLPKQVFLELTSPVSR